MSTNTITIYPKSAPDKAGFIRLYLHVSLNNSRGWYPTKVKCLKSSWDQEEQKIKSDHIDYKKLNGMLRKRIGQLQECFDALEYEKTALDIELIRERYNAKINHNEGEGGSVIVRKNYTVQEYFQMYVDDRRKVCSKGYLRNFKQTVFYLDAVKPKLKFSEVTQAFYLQFVTHLIEEAELENNTIYGHIKRLISVMGAAIIDPRTKHQEICIDFKLFSDMYVKPKVYWLDWESELACLEEFTPIEHDLPYLQFFLFMCYTGLRHSDVFKLRSENIIRKKDRVYLDHTIIKTKLDHNIELSSKAVQILQAWNFRVPHLYQHDINERIKQIAKAAGEKWKKQKRESGLLDMIEKVRYRGNERVISMLPKYQLITTHTGRRTFGRRWAEKDGEIRYLSKYYGHATVAQTEEYIGWTTVEVNAELRKVMG
jgi:integrase